MTMKAESTPLLAIDGKCATLTLNRPSRRNSLGDDDLRTLLAHFDTLNAHPDVQVVVLTANTTGHTKPVFCAGYHVGGFESDEHDPNFFEQIPDALERLRPISICAMNGSVYGGATDLMLACDLRLGLFGAELRMPAAALGLHYYPSGLRRYVSRLGLNPPSGAFFDRSKRFLWKRCSRPTCLRLCCQPTTLMQGSMPVCRRAEHGATGHAKHQGFAQRTGRRPLP
ncbi:MAG: enoyl-CoA hydratase/isomerase family protein [Betaproteobacteria bacterium]|nr:enoyl-CoA hydratase/isomerase family protein [Betaproteobacteria bacterium]